MLDNFTMDYSMDKVNKPQNIISSWVSLKMEKRLKEFGRKNI